MCACENTHTHTHTHQKHLLDYNYIVLGGKYGHTLVSMLLKKFIFNLQSSLFLNESIIKCIKLYCHMGYSFRLAARVLLYAPSHTQNSTYNSLYYTSRGALAGMRNSSVGPLWRINPMTHCTMSERSYHHIRRDNHILHRYTS